MKPATAVCVAMIGSFAPLVAQSIRSPGTGFMRDGEGRLVLNHFGFLPGEANPVRVNWRASVFEFHSTVAGTGTESRGQLLTAGEQAVGDPSWTRWEALDSDSCLLLGIRPLMAGPVLQLGLMRRVDGAWRFEAYAVLKGTVQSDVDASRPPDSFSEPNLVAWDVATRTATIAVRGERFLQVARVGDEPAGPQVLECRVPLTGLREHISVLDPAPPKGKLIAGGDELRTHRSGATCVLSAVLYEPSNDGSRPGFRLRAWQRDESGEWRNLRVPELWVERDYSMGRTTDGTLAVAMLATVGGQPVLRSARWTPGKSEERFVVTEKVLTQPPSKDATIVWQSTSDGPVAWSIENGQSALVR